MLQQPQPQVTRAKTKTGASASEAAGGKPRNATARSKGKPGEKPAGQENSARDALKLSKENEELRLNIATRFEELAELTRMYAAANETVQRHEEATQAALRTIEEKDQAIASLQADLKQKNDLIQALLKVVPRQDDKQQKTPAQRGIVSRIIGKPRRAGRAVQAQLEERVNILSRSPLFDAQWYVTTYPDVAVSGIDPVRHYLQYGAVENRDPGPGFSTEAYLVAHPDVAAAGENPLLHYVLHGEKEGRSVSAAKGQ